MNFDLTEEHKAVREAAKNFAVNDCKAVVIDRDTNQKVGFDQLKKLGELGFMFFGKVKIHILNLMLNL